MTKRWLSSGLRLLLLLLYAQTTTAQPTEAAPPLSLLIHPTYTPELSTAVHQPLADYLTGRLNHPVQLVTPRDFHKYWLDTRAGKHYDLVLEDSHIADFRRQQGTHEPLARAAEDVRYLLLSSDPLIRQPEHLIGSRISTMSSPSMGFQVLSHWYNNPMAQPQILSNSKSWLDSVEMVFANESDAAVAPDWLGERYPNLTPVMESDPMPGLTLSASTQLDPALRERLLNAMLELDENSEAYDVLNELNVSRFVAATPGDYEGLANLLDNLYAYGSR